MTAVIVIFLRLPVPGQCKTRLARGVGAEHANAAYKLLAEHALHCAHAACRLHKGLEMVVCHSSQDDSQAVQQWVQSLGIRAQAVLPQVGDEDLGAKMRAAMGRQLARPVGKVLLIGSDIPDLSPECLLRACSSLDQHEVVLGPAADGGYYLLGLTRIIPQLFEDMAWSSPTVLACTMARAQAASAALAPLDTLPQLADIDTVEDLCLWSSTHDSQGHMLAGAGMGAAGLGGGAQGCCGGGGGQEGVQGSRARVADMLHALACAQGCGTPASHVPNP